MKLRKSTGAKCFMLLCLLPCWLSCASSDSAVVAECVAAGPPVKLQTTRPGYLAAFGVLNGDFLLLSRHGDYRAVVNSAEWFSPTGEALAPPEELGFARNGIRTRLLRDGGALHAQLWIDPSGHAPARQPDEVVAMWDFRGPGDHDYHPVRLPLSRDNGCIGCGRNSLSLSIAGLSEGWNGRLPTARAGKVVSAAVGIPVECPGVTGGNFRPWLFSADGGGIVQWWDDDRTCAVHDQDLMASNVELVTLDGESDLGLLFRLGSGGIEPNHRYGHVHYLRLHEGQPVGQPRRVGGNWIHVAVDGGYQPQGTRVGRHIFFLERPYLNDNGCQVLRRIDFDGHGGDQTPWQLACKDNQNFFTNATELETLPVAVGAAGELGALVYNQRSSWPNGASYRTQLTADVPFEEGIYLSLLNESGQRASEIVRVTIDESTALQNVPRTASSGPYPANFEDVATATEGHSIYVLWTDNRPDAPGRYVRRFDCAPIAP